VRVNKGQLRARSGLSTKNGITLSNSVGTIDSDYRNELKVPVINLDASPYEIGLGDRIAQLIIAPYKRVELEEVEELEETERIGGFGSSGK
jgi:dUTP pyrophosphatase